MTQQQQDSFKLTGIVGRYQLNFLHMEQDDEQLLKYKNMVGTRGSKIQDVNQRAPLTPLDPSLLKEMNQEIGGQQSNLVGSIRYPVADTTQWPYCCIGLLVSNFIVKGLKDPLMGKATATLIGPNMILACAHSIYLKDPEIEYNVQAETVTFYPSANGKMSRGAYKVKKPFLYSKDYQTAPRNSIVEKDSDWAILVLDSPDLTNVIGSLSISVDQSDDSYLKALVGIYGYPKDKYVADIDQNLIPYMWGTTGTYDFVGNFFEYLQGETKQGNGKDTFIRHTISTEQGNSGSAVMTLKFQDKKIVDATIIGVHTSKGWHHNYGILMTNKKLALAAVWLKSAFDIKLW